MTTTPIAIDSARFGQLEIPADDVIEFPAGLNGLGGRRFALIAHDATGPFAWLHSIDDPALAVPVTNPWRFFEDYDLVVGDGDAERLGIEDPSAADVWVVISAKADAADTTVNLRAPIVVAAGRGYQVINEADEAPLRAPLFAREPAVAAA